MTARTWTRRSLLAGGLAVAVTACSTGGSTDEGGSDADAPPSGATDGRQPSEPAAPGEPTSFTAADFEGLGACRLTPEQTAGPFPLDEQFDRRDITEGSPGTPLRLGFRVVDEACAAIAGAAVEVWHADATGDYSAFTDNGGGKDEAQGTTFLRGTQTAGDDGIVEFATIYPGWYTGRAVHIHLRVHVDGGIVLTSQVYFDQALTEVVYEDEPYAELGPPDTSWDDDGIAGDPKADGTALMLERANGAVTGLLNLSVPG